MNKEIFVEALKSKCKSCGNEFEIYKLPDFLYGERILLTEDGIDYAYINCFEDRTFNIFGEMVDKYLNTQKLSQRVITECFNKVFGIACDPINGKRIDASRVKHSCAKCGSTELETIEYRPPKNVKINMPIVTHNEWEQKSDSEKESYILNELKRKKCL